MKQQFKTLYLFALTIILLCIFLNRNSVLVSAANCQEKGGSCMNKSNVDIFCAADLGYYQDDSLSGCKPDETCCVPFSLPTNDNNQDNKGLPKEIQSPTSIIPYKFETGIPGIAKKGETLKAMTLTEFVKLLIRYVFRISGILAFIMIVWGGILYLTSGGDAKKQKSAQEKITGAVIGLILLFAFWIILNTINPDILRAPKIGIDQPSPPPSSSGPPSPSSPLSPNHPEEIRQLAKKILTSDKFIIEFLAAIKDLQDVINNKCTDVVKNSTLLEANCIPEAKSKGLFPNCPTIQGNLLKAISVLPEYVEKVKQQGNTSYGSILKNCSDQVAISPFISDHYYCGKSIFNSHAKGKAVDVTLYAKNKDPKITEQCTAALAGFLCPGKETLVKDQYLCTTKLNGITIHVYGEILENNQPHIHLYIIP